MVKRSKELFIVIGPERNYNIKEEKSKVIVEI